MKCPCVCSVIPTDLIDTQAEFDTLFSEMGVVKGLDNLDALIARQPELTDGSRVYVQPLYAFYIGLALGY